MCKEVTLIYLNFLWKVLGVQEYYKTCIEFLANSKIFCILGLGARNKKKGTLSTASVLEMCKKIL